MITRAGYAIAAAGTMLNPTIELVWTRVGAAKMNASVRPAWNGAEVRLEKKNTRSTACG
jgi:hypothetical protein